MKTHNRSTVVFALEAMTLAAISSIADGVWVSNNADEGEGSFRTAVLYANGDPSIGWIKFTPDVGTVVLTEPVEFTGAQPLSIEGRGASLMAAPGVPEFDLLVASGGGQLSIADLEFAGGANGLVVAGPITVAEDLRVWLSNVAFVGNTGFGLLIDDGGSAGGVQVTLHRCDFSANGTGASDRDGLRVNERDSGGIEAVLKECVLSGNGGDAAEFDEAGDGDVTMVLLHSIVELNGFQDSSDLEDGIDIDEADAGDVEVLIADLELSRNKQQGLESLNSEIASC